MPSCRFLVDSLTPQLIRVFRARISAIV
ncbi:MAG: hypothetical protein ACD_10C00558G0003, partial [uncultured bacterium]